MSAVVLALDAGTTGVRTFAVDETGTPLHFSYREFTQHFPRPGWVEHDPEEIWDAMLATMAECVARTQDDGHEIVAIGITNQRETAVVWDRRDGSVPHRAIVWQDRRTAELCDRLRDAGHEPLVREQTGLVIDSYFSATKLAWLFGDAGVEAHADLCFGTVDAWLLWKLTGGPDGGVRLTDETNASRTLLYDIGEHRWSDDLLELFGVPRSCLPEVRPSSGRFGVTRPEHAAGLEVPVSGIAGDQQSALFGQACFDVGMSKNTYGTGSFVLMNLGDTLPRPTEGLLTTVACRTGDAPAYALEGAIFVTGAAIQWLRDGIGIIDDAAETGPLAASVDDAGGVVFVPAFTGLGSPHWDPYARGAILGVTRGTGRAEIARAVVESMAWQTADVVRAMADAAGLPVLELRVDGGASVMDVLCQFQADVLRVPVRRPVVAETTALGAVYLAGIAEGVWASPSEAAAAWREERSFRPVMPADAVERRHRDWTRAVDRSRGWARE